MRQLAEADSFTPTSLRIRLQACLERVVAANELEHALRRLRLGQNAVGSAPASAAPPSATVRLGPGGAESAEDAVPVGDSRTSRGRLPWPE